MPLFPPTLAQASAKVIAADPLHVEHVQAQFTNPREKMGQFVNFQINQALIQQHFRPYLEQLLAKELLFAHKDITELKKAEKAEGAPNPDFQQAIAAVEREIRTITWLKTHIEVISHQTLQYLPFLQSLDNYMNFLKYGDRWNLSTSIAMLSHTFYFETHRINSNADWEGIRQKSMENLTNRWEKFQN